MRPYCVSVWGIKATCVRCLRGVVWDTRFSFVPHLIHFHYPITILLKDSITRSWSVLCLISTLFVPSDWIFSRETKQLVNLSFIILLRMCVDYVSQGLDGEIVVRDDRGPSPTESTTTRCSYCWILTDMTTMTVTTMTENPRQRKEWHLIGLSLVSKCLSWQEYPSMIYCHHHHEFVVYLQQNKNTRTKTCFPNTVLSFVINWGSPLCVRIHASACLLLYTYTYI